ncbi:MAG TPA: HlyD family type I secretion periplasmic adaptor subunit, partial [Candidatus Handelsmanbacteria bacterium]|nr:HlyD family type I secretion periplasmic adaptor subunit [Candidatus Handelsmanbacteria bacterium]
GQPLVKLDETQSLAQLEIVNSQFTALRVREARLIAERDGLDSVVYPADLTDPDAKTRQEQDAQRGIFAARQATRQVRDEVLEQRIEQLRSRVGGIEALKASKQSLAVSYAEELEDARALLSQGFSDKNRLRELERAHATHTGEAADLVAQISGAQIQIGETRLEMIRLEREFQNEVVGELAETQTTLADIEERIKAVRDVDARTTIRSPVDGVVNGLQFHTIGGVISPGIRILDVVPQNDDLIVEARVSPNDIDRVALNQEATIRFSAFDRSVPTTFGRVAHLSADSFVDEATGVQYYTAKIEVTDEGLKDLEGLQLIPGMPAEVFISTGSRTLLEYLFKPLSNALARSFIED